MEVDLLDTEASLENTLIELDSVYGDLSDLSANAEGQWPEIEAAFNKILETVRLVRNAKALLQPTFDGIKAEMDEQDRS